MQATVETVNDNVDTTLSYEMESKMKYKFAAIEKRKEARAENISKVMTALFNFDSFIFSFCFSMHFGFLFNSLIHSFIFFPMD